MSVLLDLHPHGFGIATYIQHLVFEAMADAGGWYASRYCTHLSHRIIVAVAFALTSTFLLTWLIG